MKPNLFRLEDFTFIPIPLLISITIVVFMLFDHTARLIGYIIGSSVIFACLFIIFMYYYKRWRFISRWRFVTSTGLNCYFEKGTCYYSEQAVEADLDFALVKWAEHLNREGVCSIRKVMEGDFIDGATCIFRPEETFIHTEPGWWSRRVYGIAGWNWCVVGQGNKHIRYTAFKHEISHILYNNYMGMLVPEAEAHKVFAEIGISNV